MRSYNEKRWPIFFFWIIRSCGLLKLDINCSSSSEGQKKLGSQTLAVDSSQVLIYLWEITFYVLLIWAPFWRYELFILLRSLKTLGMSNPICYLKMGLKKPSKKLQPLDSFNVNVVISHFICARPFFNSLIHVGFQIMICIVDTL